MEQTEQNRTVQPDQFTDQTKQIRTYTSEQSRPKKTRPSWIERIWQCSTTYQSSPNRREYSYRHSTSKKIPLYIVCVDSFQVFSPSASTIKRFIFFFVHMVFFSIIIYLLTYIYNSEWYTLLFLVVVFFVLFLFFCYFWFANKRN